MAPRSEPEKRAPGPGGHPAKPHKVVIGTTPSDSHTWNLVNLQLLFEEMGYEVVNLGACTPLEQYLKACRRHHPDLLVVSSVNGHGVEEGKLLISGLRDHVDLDEIPAVIGGKLSTSGHLSDEDAAALRGAGFSHVLEESEDPSTHRAVLAGLDPRPLLTPQGDTSDEAATE